jgi:hypothetical protein
LSQLVAHVLRGRWAIERCECAIPHDEQSIGRRHDQISAVAEDVPQIADVLVFLAQQFEAFSGAANDGAVAPGRAIATFAIAADGMTIAVQTRPVGSVSWTTETRSASMPCCPHCC